MPKSQTIVEFYKERSWLPVYLQHDIGHFNVFRLDPFVGKGAKPAPYRRREWYNITLVHGPGKYIHAGRAYEVAEHALVFDNPQVPFGWEQRERVTGGYFCIFDPGFFHGFGNPGQYAVFQPGGPAFFEISANQAAEAAALFERMLAEIGSDYVHKYDLLRTLVFELLHMGMKLRPSSEPGLQPPGASQRIAARFLELLERQFPIDDPHQTVSLRSAAGFAERLTVHVNHLNRAIREITGKTTTQHITERVLGEARALLKQTSWNVSEIAYALGFSEPSHFVNFFSKHMGQSPLKFRQS